MGIYINLEKGGGAENLGEGGGKFLDGEWDFFFPSADKGNGIVGTLIKSINKIR